VFIGQQPITRVIVSDDQSDNTPKLSRVTPLRLSEEVNTRVQAAARRHHVKRPEWIRQAIMAELARDEAEAAARSTVTPEQAALLELCATAAKRGGDPRQALTEALEAKLAADAAA
jgi:predicted transcriptional regulator